VEKRRRNRAVSITGKSVMKEMYNRAVGNCLRAYIFIMLLVTMLIESCINVYAGNSGILWDTYGDTRLEIDRRDPEVNQPFVVNNLFPGDVISQDYKVKVCHKGTVQLHFQTAVRPGYEQLGKVLKLRVEVEGEVLYDGLMTEMPKTITYSVVPDKRRTVISEVDYLLTTYLDTDVGNEYQNQDLIADFQWWVLVKEQSEGGYSGEEGDHGDGGAPSDEEQIKNLEVLGRYAETGDEQADGYLMVLPRTGDIIGWIGGVAIVSGVIFLMLCLFGKRRKEEEDEA